MAMKLIRLILPSLIVAIGFRAIIFGRIYQEFGRRYNQHLISLEKAWADSFVSSDKKPPSVASSGEDSIVNDPDVGCIFRDSPLYRSIFVYPSPRDSLFASMKSRRGTFHNSTVPMWQWLEMNEQFRESRLLMYNIHHNDENHFATDVYVHDIVTHPESCLQTNDPDSAKLFYIPHLETLHWRGLELLEELPPEWKTNMITPYGEALMAAMDGNYTPWEERYGLTSQYWRRKKGADHFFVMSEPCNGLIHLGGKQRGNHNYIVTQRQHTPPIVISIELSTTFVDMYPKCAAKNIVIPYANVDGKWFRGYFEEQAKAVRNIFVQTTNNKTAAITSKKRRMDDNARPILVHYEAGGRGQCNALRRGLNFNHICNNKSYRMVAKKKIPRQVQMQLSKFCPCPAGDSPSARRMFDAVASGCIPVILASDFVWPLTKEVDPSLDLDPATFSLRLNFTEFGQFMFQGQCQRVGNSSSTLEEYLETIPGTEVRRLQEGLRKVAPLFEYYRRRSNMSDTPLSDRLIPDGGAAHALVHELAKRATEHRWEQCEEELKLPRSREPTTNPC
jgi:hypothetical protein